MKVNASIKLLLLIVLVFLALPISIFVISNALNQHKHDAEILNYIGFIRGSTQRYHKLDDPAKREQVVKEIEEKFDYLKFDVVGNSIFQHPDFIRDFDLFKAQWNAFHKAVNAQAPLDELNTLAARCWELANQTNITAQTISANKHEQLITIILVVGFFTLVLLFYILYIIHYEVRNYLETNIIRDPLTQLYNRIYLIEQLQYAVKSYKRQKQPFVLIFMDIDFFKQVNDTYGHAMGDTILVELSQLLGEELREEDLGFRFGGEEFVILAKNTSLKEGCQMAERLRQKVESYAFSTNETLTISLGVSQYQEGEDYNALLNRADELLYEAKHDGRNRYCSA